MNTDLEHKLSNFEAFLGFLSTAIDFAPLLICLALFAISCMRLDRSGHTFSSALSSASDATVTLIKSQPVLAIACLSFWGASKALFNAVDLSIDRGNLLIGLSLITFSVYSIVLSVSNVSLVQRMARADGLIQTPFKAMVTATVQLTAFNFILSVSGAVGAFFVLPALWLFARTALVAPLIVLHSGGMFAALKESWRLTAGQFWLISYLLLPIVVVQLLPDFVGSLIALTVPESLIPDWVAPVIQAADMAMTPVECALDFLYIGLSYQLYRRLKD